MERKELEPLVSVGLVLWSCHLALILAMIGQLKSPNALQSNQKLAVHCLHTFLTFNAHSILYWTASSLLIPSQFSGVAH